MPNLDGIMRKDKPEPADRHDHTERPLTPLEKYKEALRRRLSHPSERADHSRFRTKEQEDRGHFWE